MAMYTQMNEMFTRQSIDSKIFDEEDGSTLDEDILNTPDFATSDYGTDIGRSTTPVRFSSNNPFRNNSLHDSSGATTPKHFYDTYSEFDPLSATTFISSASLNGAATPFDLSQAAYSHPLSIVPSSHSGASIPESPLSGQDWMSAMASEDIDGRQMARRVRQGGARPSSPVLRPDGIRKKNARFEIPAERNLHNIDHLITQSTDDQEIKELKQQKRLLRNRQAALDSRQRKKQHTERLEEEKKYYTERITELEEKVDSLELRNANHLRHEDDFRAMRQSYEQYIETLRFEKEELIAKYTNETADLRKKNTFLMENMSKMETPPFSSSTSSTFSSDFPDLESSFMDGAFSIDFPADPCETKPSMALVPTNSEKMVISEEDKSSPAASGLLLVLLLCGALVASKGPASSNNAIPQMSEEIREASATVLDNMFKDAGVSHAESAVIPAPTHVVSIEQAEPAASAWPSSSASASMVGLSDSSLDILNQRLVAPSKEQEAEQLFSLSADQYNSVTSQEFGRIPETGSSSYGRRNFEASLAAMRAESESKKSVADVYTRSLLLDKVPAQVVRDFAKLVAAHNRQEATPEGADGD